MARILMMNLPVLINSYRTVMPPLGLQYIASNIKGDHTVGILDQILNYDQKQPAPQANQFIYGISKGSLKKTIESFNPDIIGISCNFSYQHAWLKETLEAVKEIVPQVKTIIGGNHVTAYYQGDFPRLDNVDAVILGEAEEAFNDYLEGHLDQTKFHQVKDLDGLAFPSRLNMQPYYDTNLQHHGNNREGARVVVMITSRGCFSNCIFCSVRNIWGRGIRYRSAENVLAEIDEIVNKHGANEVHFEDDNLLFHKERCLKIFKGMEKFKIRWICPNGVDLSKIDDEILEAMKASGCYQITICPETVTDRILKFYRKPFNFETIKKKMALIRKHGFPMVGYFIIGAPDETLQEMWDTIRFAQNEFENQSTGILAPYIGTDLFDYCLKHNLLYDDDLLGFKNNNFANMQADIIATFKRAVNVEDIRSLCQIQLFMKSYKLKI